MRISDWSSDVCSSDLDQPLALQVHHGHGAAAVLGHLRRLVAGAVAAVEAGEQPLADAAGAAEEGMANGGEVVERAGGEHERSEEHTSELPSLMRISYAVFCLKKK